LKMIGSFFTTQTVFTIQDMFWLVFNNSKN